MKNPQDLLDHKALFDRYCALQPHELSSFHFSSIFLWQDFFDFEFRQIKEHLCVFARQEKSSFLYLPPLGKGPFAGVMDECFTLMDQVNPRTARIENVSQGELPQFNDSYKAYPKASEYIYNKQDLIDLKGHAYKSQRHDIHLFQSHHEALFRPYEKADLGACLSLYERWARERSQKNTDVIYRAMLEENRRVHELALLYQEPLKLVGYVVEIDKKIAAYSLGYSLNCQVFCVLLEITDLNFKGLSALIFNRFCSSQEMKEARFVNTMDDFGMPMVAKAKQAYHPIKKPVSYTLSKIK